MLVPLAFGQEAEVTAEAVEVAEVAPGLERPVDTDVMLLKNGDKLTGDVLNEEFSIRTSYADLTFNQESLAGIDLEDRINDMEVLITANDNRFSGFLDDSVFRFKLVTGPEIAVRREKVARVVFRREAEPVEAADQEFIVLRNGDFFNGRVTNTELVVNTAYARVPVQLADMRLFKVIGGEAPMTRILLENGDMIQGQLETEDISVELAAGPAVQIYKDRINTVFCGQGERPPESTTDKAYLADLKQARDRRICINHLRLIDRAKMQWALEHDREAGDVPGKDDLDPYIPGGSDSLKCPDDGEYRINPIGIDPECTISGHRL
jgi:hypothetical protein